MKNIEMSKIAAVVILYKPDLNTIIRNINTYINQVNRVYVIDNSDNSLRQYLSVLNVEYISIGENKGIAYALNYGIKLASNDTYEWVITFDQDSLAPENLVSTLYQTALAYTGKIGIVAPAVSLFDTHIPHVILEPIERNAVITSGSLCSVEAFVTVGGLDENMFIDWVDIEYCMHLRSKGYKIIEQPNVMLIHQLGQTRELKLFGKHIAFITNHNYIRRYYSTRNALYLSKKWQKQYPSEVKVIEASIWKTILKVIFWENDKKRKFRAIKIAKEDAKNGIYGKINIKRINQY